VRIAIVGAGVSGNVAAHVLAPRHDVTVFEAAGYVGGHTNTIRVDDDDGSHELDTGFMVFNEERYPLFSRLLRDLGVRSKPTSMSFSVHGATSPLEYSSRALFARRRNLTDPRFLRTIGEIARINRALGGLRGADASLLLGTYLDAQGYSQHFRDWFLYPMGAAIWSSDPEQLPFFPLHFFARFFGNHRFLDIAGQPTWCVVERGARRYVEALIRPFSDRIRTSSRVHRVSRRGGRLALHSEGGGAENFDHVVMALHADDALAILEDPTETERQVLGAFRYQDNETVVHTDTSLMPKRRRAWASWNVHVPATPRARATVTYDLNILQGLSARREYLVTLNDTSRIDPAKRIKTISYWHPVYSEQAVKAQKRRAEISGVDRMSYCGAYWGFGFHEDGVESAVAVGREIEERRP